ncbi:MAG: CGGC domain-containing protein [Bacillota bacterium]
MNVLVVSCGRYAAGGYGCPGEWKCFGAAAKREGEFTGYDDVKVVGFLPCDCPGRELIANIGCVKKNTDVDVVHLSTCMVKAWPACPHMGMDELVQKITEKFDVRVVKGTHNYS